MAAISVVLVALITAGTSFLNSRNDRDLTAKELALLKQMDPASPEAERLREVIGARIERWHRRAYKVTVDRSSGRRSETQRKSGWGADLAFAILVSGTLTGLFSLIFAWTSGQLP